MKAYYDELLELIESSRPNAKKLIILKHKLSKKHHFKIPSNIEILSHADDKQAEHLKHLLLTKPVRTQSGVAVVAIMTKPFPCPHGRCIYCPGGINSQFGNVPQSYTGHEPAALRGIRADYDSYVQVMNRLEQYVVSGHNPAKVELIIMGGTFPSFPENYKKDFVAYAYKAMNDFGEMFYDKDFEFKRFKEFFELPGSVGDAARVELIKKKLLNLKNNLKEEGEGASLDYEKKRNESGRIRCVALCIETKPDCSAEKHVNQMLDWGTTRIEMGVQTLNDSTLKLINRGHDVKDIVAATRLLKDSFLKVGYHMMPGLPNSTPESDLAEMKELFNNKNYRPDALKIYPCMVFEKTPLYELYKSGKFVPLTSDEAALIIAKSKKFVPEYCRIMRIQRDIPSKFATAGIMKNNLRQIIKNKTDMLGIKCRCIRCREPKQMIIDVDDVQIRTNTYEASGGTEVFISAVEPSSNILAGFCRLRIPSQIIRPEITPKSAGVRELHVYSLAIPLGVTSNKSIQHKGLGTRLLREAERIANEVYDMKELLVISGVGVRQYYKERLGYKQKGVYVAKVL